MTTKVNSKKETTKKVVTKKETTKKVEKTPVETKTEEPDHLYTDDKGILRVPKKLQEEARLATESKEHKKYNKIQSLRTFKYEVYYGDASHEPGHHGEKQKEFKNLQTAINWIAKEAKFFVEEGIERECYSIVLDEKLIAEY